MLALCRASELFVLLSLCCVVHATATTVFTPVIAPMGEPVLVATYGTSQLYASNVTGYDSPFWIANLSGPTRFDLGYAAGTLLLQHAMEDQNFLFNSLFGGDVIGQDIF